MNTNKTRWTAVAAALLAGVVTGCAFGKMAPALPILKAELGLSLVQTGWLVSAFNGLAAAGAIFFGVFSDRLGAKRFCVFGLCCLIAGGLLGAVTSGPTLLVLSRLVEGLGFMSVIVSAPALINLASAPAQRGIAFGMWSSYMPFGAGLVLASSSFLLPIWGWRGVWVVVMLATVACLLFLLSQSAHYVSAVGTKRSFADIRASLSRPAVWLLGLAFAMYTIQNHAIFVWLPTYLIEERGISPSNAMLLTALSITVNCFGNVFGGWLIQRNVPRGKIVGVTFCLTAILFTLIFAANLPDGLRYALVVVYNVVCGPIPAAALSGAAKYARSPSEVGATQGLVVQITQCGIFFGPPITAAVVTAAGSWNAALWVLLTASTIGLITSIFISRAEKRMFAAQA